MRDAEMRFLALLALGMFSIDDVGMIWRHKEWTKGSRTGSAPALVAVRTRRRADVSLSGRRHRGSTMYRRVMFVADNRRWKIAAHRVVWMVANGEPIPEGLEINHKNGNGMDNRPSNLEVVSTSQNALHSIHVLGSPRKGRPGSTNSSAHLTEAHAAGIRRLAALKTMPQWKIGELFGVSQQTVTNIHCGKTWRHISIS